MKLSLNEIINHFGFGNNEYFDLQVKGITTDSRKVSSGDIFVAIKGENFDGNNFVDEAFNNGAICAVVDKSIEGKDKVFKVDNTIDFLQDLAKYYLGKFDVKKIGITGSVGKSTVREMVYSILETEFKVTKTDKNFNGQIGTPLTIFNIDDDTQVAVFEMGISIPGEMEKLVNMVNPDFAVVNNIGTSHLGNFSSLEVTCNEKMKISSKNCILCLNGDNYELLNFPNKVSKKTVYFGFNGNFNYVAENILQLENKTDFVLVSPSYRESITIPCLGLHQVYNALASISLSLEFGIHIESVKKGLLKFKPLPMRQNIIRFKNFTLIDDSYNASPDSIKASVKLLESINHIGRNIIVIADILELGSYSHRIHFDIGKYMSSCKIDVLITIGKESKYIEDGIRFNKKEIEMFHFLNNDDAYNKILQILQTNDKILVKGSRSMKTENIVKKIVDQFESGIGEQNEKSQDFY